MENHVLLTGATGFLGQYLLWDLLKKGVPVCAIVRAEQNEGAKCRINSILSYWEAQRNETVTRPVCFAGDVCEENFGLGDDDLGWVTENCQSILHNAAVVSFDNSAVGQPMQTNVSGAENLVGVCAAANIRQVHHVSTAYVCGIREGVILESELERSQQFRNEYEESKLEAEKILRSADAIGTLSVYRPAVIAGDSKTGYTQTYHGVFHYLKLISLIVRNVEPDENGARFTPIKVDMDGDEPRNIVPVDWVSKVICQLYCDNSAHGNTFHLAPDVRLTAQEIMDAGYTYFNSYGVEFCGANANLNGSKSQINRDWHSNMSIYKNYENTDPIFDTSNLKKFAGDIPCPRIDEAMLHRFWEFGESSQWGKRTGPLIANS